MSSAIIIFWVFHFAFFVCFCLLYIFTNNYHFFVCFVLFLLSYKSNPNGYKMVCHYRFSSLVITDVERHSGSYWPFVYHFLKMFTQVPYPLKNQVVLSLLLNCISSLYILYINLLAAIWFRSIFSKSKGSLLTLFIVSFDAWKFKNIYIVYYFFLLLPVFLVS